MNRRSQRMVGRFTAYDDAGSSYVVEIFADYVNTSSRSEGTSEIETTRELYTLDGHHVNYIKKGEYRIIGAQDIMIHSTDEHAP